MRIAISLLCMFVATSVSAEWIENGKTKEAVAYIDPTPMDTDENFMKIQMLQDFNKKQEEGYRSVRSIWEFDCKGDKYRMLALFMYAEPMGGGRNLDVDDIPGEWIESTPSSGMGRWQKAVCGK